MKLSKELEKEVRQAYQEYWDCYMKGDSRKITRFLDSNIKMMGTTESEVFNNKKEVIDFFMTTADGVAGKTEMRNRDINIVPLEDLILITEQLDLYVLSNAEWVFYSKVRLSSLMQRQKTGWKIIQQHGSMPDSRTQKGESSAFERITKENLELRDAVNRRTVELENKSRALEMESSLERVRTVAMGMKVPEDMLDVCRVISKELQALGIKEIRNVQTAIVDEEEASYLNYEYFQLHEKTFITAVEYKKHKDVNAFVNKMLKDPDGFFTKTFEGAELKDWMEYQAKAGQFVDPHLKKISSLHYYFYSIGPGALGISAYAPMSKEGISLFKHFRNVFLLAYRRFLDIQQAKAQAREAKIEAALEKVRAKVMAMNSSKDLNDTSLVFGEQLRKLGIDWQFSYFWLIETDKDENTFWITWPDNKTSTTTYSLAEADESFRECIIAWQRQDKIHTSFIAPEAVVEWLNTFERITADAGGAALKIMQPGNFKEGVYYYDAMIRFGSFGILTNRPINEEEKSIQSRFAVEFERAYTRFLDLQKAEAQAREAKIEAALERVRSRTMAMQHSDELKDAANLLFRQVKELGINAWSAGYGTWLDGHKACTLYMSSEDQMQVPFIYPHTEDPASIRFAEGADKGLALYVEEMGGEALASHYRYMRGLPLVGEMLEEIRKAGFDVPLFQVFHVAYYSHGYLLFITYEPVPEAHAIFKRFGNVFEQTYTRFLDLQKAEAQAKEAQIETALERVRSRSMAMQKSGELKEVIQVVYEQFVHLNILIEHTGFIIDYKARGDMHIWLADRHEVPSQVTIPYFDCAHWNSFNEAKEKGIDFFANQLSFEEKNKFYQDLFKLIPGLPEEAKEYYFNCPGLAISTVLLENVGLYIENFSGIPYTDEENNTLMRFGKVFQQTYTRFLDLQKAEVRAREAKIEAALERVRSKAMAMHKSEDLSQAVATVFEELDKLNLGTLRCGIGIINKEKRSADYWVTSVSDKERYVHMAGDETMDSHPLLQGAFDAWLKQEDFSYSLKGDDLTRYYKAMVDTNFPLPESQFVLSDDEISEQHYHLACFEAGGLFAFRGTPFPEEAKSVMKRFSGVFNLTYKRFLDLQKAEAQAREAQVQLALERVRARTMAMQKSDELLETSQVLYRQLKELGEPADQLTIGIVNEQERVVEVSATREDSHLQQIFRHNIDEATVMSKMYEDWKAGKKSKVLDISGEELKLYNQYRNQLIGSNMFPTTLQAGDRRVIYAAFFSKGMLALATVEPRPEESIQLLERFATVFDLTYTRFLDLQKAEAQGREARIEASLERVRSKAMAMHSSRDLADTIGAFYHELETFHITPRRCGVGLLEKDSKSAELSTMNTTDQRQSLEIVGKIKMEGHPVLEGVYENWLVQKEFHPVLRGNEIKEYYQMLKPQIQFPDYPNDSVQYGYFFYFPEGGVYAWTDKEMAEDELKIYRRFTAVLSLTYKRYKELKEAEAQTRESQIELGLERVRARAMAMQKSDELKELIGTVFTELTKLDLVLTRCLIMIYDPKTNGSTWWIANSEARAEPMSFFVKYHENPPYLAYLAAWQERKLKWQYVLEGKDKLDWDDFIFAETELSYLPDFVIAGMRAPERVYLSASFNNFGNLTLASLEPLSPEHSDILLRFAKVFDLTYTRFNDLKQAEAQARQAKIEAAMEKVRSRALAMQKPDELIEVAAVLRKEMGWLGVEELETSSIYIHNEASGKTECWFAMKDTQQEKQLVADHLTIDLNETAVGRQMLAFYQSGKKQISIVMQGANRKEWIHYCAKHSKVFGSSGFYGDNIPDRTYHLYKFSNGYMGAASPGNISAESWDLLQRATSVFSLAYTRFSDLQHAEASAKEAVKQAALDRIRAEIASMRTTSDLEKITPLIWKELTILGIPFIRCGVFIMDDSQQLIHTFLSTPDGKAIAAFHLPYSTPGNLSQVVRNWQHKKIYIDHWDEEEFIRFSDILTKQGALTSREQYLKTIPQGGFYLHFLPFLQGMLYAGNTTQLSEKDIKLLQSVADAFSTAYARYEDFNKLEAAKHQVDKALTDLKQTQQQLVQSEKMASLGELTAGIAHEIQNPLNFVNNFAEVSNELLSEMVEEVSKGNYEEAKHIAGDVKSNLEKIDYHGKRADAIVKGMLQHSRTSSGQKELTDINELAEEYLRLAYHGWRAKDKSFNAKFETEFDPEVGKISITSQDIGRVILNLINNAFYAVAEKKKHSNGGYEPLVSIITKRVNGNIEIIVKDSGNGIPQQVLEKIFQPFFTTKPTGQGTGLGLSLSYDIVKAHGGELKVETKEGKGAAFIIHLPAKR